MEVKLRALEAIVDIQNEKITRMQAQFDVALAQMVAVIGPGEDDLEENTGEVAAIESSNPELDIS